MAGELTSYWLARGRGVVGPAPPYDPDALALFARFTTPPTDDRKALINSTIIALKSASLWDKFDYLHVKAAADSQAARRNWIADLYNAVAVSSPTFTADRGFTGNGTTSYLRPGFIPSAAGKMTQNSISMGTWTLTDIAATRYHMGVRDTGGGVDRTLSIDAVSDGRFISRSSVLTAGNLTVSGMASTKGLYSFSRSSASAVTAYKNGATAGTSAASTSQILPTTEIYSGASSTAGVAGGFSTDQYAVEWAGSSMTDADQLAMYTIFTTYLTAVGALP